MGILIELVDKDYQYCLDYACGKTNTLALNNVNRLIKAVADGTPLDENKISYAIETMRKYQKIKEQVDIAIDKENFAISGARLIQIREIINRDVD